MTPHATMTARNNLQKQARCYWATSERPDKQIVRGRTNRASAQIACHRAYEGDANLFNGDKFSLVMPALVRSIQVLL
jgi:hypothetical protein